MPKEYEITYKAENSYENWVHDAYWQFLIIPMENKCQHEVEIEFSNSLFANKEISINGYGFKTIRISPKKKFKHISFEAKFKLKKEEVNPYNFDLDIDNTIGYKRIDELDFKIIHERFLKFTSFTKLNQAQEELFLFNNSVSIFKNLQDLNSWTYKFIHFKSGVTEVGTLLNVVIVNKQGVCQDFTHLFCALARVNGIPTRYVSGYLNQGSGLFGDSQMHAWAEAYVPEIGWIGFDPTNDLLANTNHIKVCHGKDYNDCSPLKGIIYSQGLNKTTHAVTVQSQQ
ncbi:transglutaminase family protein [uncultured Maribacter sp.]|uniref:transglutaminase-like domain-containing protein n=1 Tax=uncultured Maribacter sp. TaxID=431308 RepID=UPI0030EB4523|tara:strand:+ start:42195 stop:43046 length:852 start_codon:yes stop_codon:yes gene_type:complete